MHERKTLQLETTNNIEQVIIHFVSSDTTLAESAFNHLHEKWQAPLFRIARSICNDDHFAEEVVNDAYMKLWSSRHKLIPKEKIIFAWLATTTRYRAIDRVRGRARKMKIEVPLADDVSQQHTQGKKEAELLKALEVLCKEIENLDIYEQNMVFLRLSEMPDYMAAEMLSLSQSGFRYKLSNIMKKLEKALKAEGITYGFLVICFKNICEFPKIDFAQDVPHFAAPPVKCKSTSFPKKALGKHLLFSFLALFVIGAITVTWLIVKQSSIWASTYGGSENDRAFCISPTSDGGSVVAGETYSFGAGSRDVLLMRFDQEGNLLWQHAYGGTGEDCALDVFENKDGDFIVGGLTMSFGVEENSWWLIKADKNGEIIWQKTYGDYGWEGIYEVDPTPDDCIIVAGYTGSYDSETPKNDMWVMKVDTDGEILWQKAYGTKREDTAEAVAVTSDGGFVLTGGTYSYTNGERDAWVVKINEYGKVEWAKVYGGPEDDNGYSIEETADGGFIVAGHCTSFGMGDIDMWAMKLDCKGNTEWVKTIGGKQADECRDVHQTQDGGYILAGETASFGGGGKDIWLVKLSEKGQIEWQKSYGGTGDDGCYSAYQITTKSNDSNHEIGYRLAGYTRSFSNGNDDIWNLRMDNQGNIIGLLFPGFLHRTNAEAQDAPFDSIDIIVENTNTSAIPIDTTSPVHKCER